MAVYIKITYQYSMIHKYLRFALNLCQRNNFKIEQTDQIVLTVVSNTSPFLLKPILKFYEIPHFKIGPHAIKSTIQLTTSNRLLFSFKIWNQRIEPETTEGGGGRNKQGTCAWPWPRPPGLRLCRTSAAVRLSATSRIQTLNRYIYA